MTREPWRLGDRAARAPGAVQGKTLEGFGFEIALPCAQPAPRSSTRETQRGRDHLLRPERVDAGAHLVLDRATCLLELTEAQRGARREGSLLDTIDATFPMGAAMRDRLLSPLRDVEAISAGRAADRVRGGAVPARGPHCGRLDVERLVAG